MFSISILGKQKQIADALPELSILGDETIIAANDWLLRGVIC